jgi:16S rRNA (cytosine1402-N4)-methyltransferase
MDVAHVPVLLSEVVDNLVSEQSGLFVDATVGGAGHAYSVLERFHGLKLIGIDADEHALEAAEKRLHVFRDRVRLLRGNFRDLRVILDQEGVTGYDGILFDLGLSMFQIQGRRGFSFTDDDFLDMRMDSRQALTAFDVVNTKGYDALVRIIREYGEEWRAPQIARAIVEERKKGPIATARALSDTVTKAKRRTGRIHPATRTFQAIRIEVNDELESLRQGMRDAIDMLEAGGRIGIMSFHSLEDRIVKETFRSSPVLRVVTKKPIRPEREEVRENPRARSAKFRIAEKI